MADGVGLVLLSVPLLDELVDGDEVLETQVELFNAVVGLALVSEVLHILLSVAVSGSGYSEESEGGKRFHLSN